MSLDSGVGRHAVRDAGAAVRAPAVAAVAFGVLAAGVAAMGPDSGVGRALLILLLLGAPGAAVAAMLRELEPLGRAVCALISAVLVNAAVAQTMLSLKVWSVAGGVAAVGVLSSLGWYLAGRRHPAIPVTTRSAELPIATAGEREVGR
jgi:hypothetical protein